MKVQAETDWEKGVGAGLGVAGGDMSAEIVCAEFFRVKY
jgi:hypothetical protein